MKIQLSDHFGYRRLFRFVLSPIIMMVFTSLYGVIDGLFVSNFVGKVPFAAINLVMPFIMILGGIGFMIGTGGSALVAKNLGEGSAERANNHFSMMIYLTLILGIIASVVGIIFIRPIALFLNATDEMLDDCIIYGRCVLTFNTAYMLQNVFQSFLITAEKPKLGLAATVAAGVTNIVLDALFIIVFNMGVAGAAIATGISQVVGGIFPLIYFIRPNSSRLRLKRTKLRMRPIIQACANGSSELMSNISSSLVSMIYNFQLLKYAGADGVATYGVLMYIQFIFIAVFIGYSIGSSPIVSYHYGAGNTSEMKNILRKSSVSMISAGVLMTLLAKAVASPLAGIFVGYDAALFEMTKHAFSIFSFSFLLAGINIFASAFFTALNNGGVSAAISFLRTLLFQTASVIILPHFFDLDGIWAANTIAEVFAFIVSISFLFAKGSKYKYF